MEFNFWSPIIQLSFGKKKIEKKNWISGQVTWVPDIYH